MIKRTLYFGNPVYLKTKDEQLVFKAVNENKDQTIPIEDIGIVILDNRQITITHCVLEKLLANNVALITCDSSHHPTGMMLNLNGNSLQSSRYREQAAASLPLRKQLWQQTIIAKINNQAALLQKQRVRVKNLHTLARNVKSGDTDNCEAQAAVFYWKNIFPLFPDFRREREGDPPNNLLNYGYSLVRALIARNLVGSGLIPTLGIFHRNQYNAYCLADDIMEPYRPFVDMVVADIIRMNGNFLAITPAMKRNLLSIPAMDVQIGGEKSPMMVAAQCTTASLAKCFEGKSKTIVYPQLT